MVRGKDRRTRLRAATNTTRAARASGAVPFLVVIPILMIVVWMIVQIAVSTIAGVAAQHAASTAARRLSDQRSHFASEPEAFCEALEQLGGRYGSLVQDWNVTVAGNNATGQVTGTTCADEVNAADSNGRECDTAVDGFEVVVQIDAAQVLPDGGGIGLSVLDRLHATTAASCAPLRAIPNGP